MHKETQTEKKKQHGQAMCRAQRFYGFVYEYIYMDEVLMEKPEPCYTLYVDCRVHTYGIKTSFQVKMIVIWFSLCLFLAFLILLVFYRFFLFLCMSDEVHSIYQFNGVIQLLYMHITVDVMTFQSSMQEKLFTASS